MKEDKPRDASLALTQGKELAPSAAAIEIAQGDVEFRQGKIPEAQTDCLAALTIEPANPRSLLGLARVYKGASFNRRSKDLIDRAPNLDPDIEEFWMATLSRAEKIRHMEARLTKPNKEENKLRESTKDHRQYLKALDTQPLRRGRAASGIASTELRLESLLLLRQHLGALDLTVSINGQNRKMLLDSGAGPSSATDSRKRRAYKNWRPQRQGESETNRMRILT